MHGTQQITRRLQACLSLPQPGQRRRATQLPGQRPLLVRQAQGFEQQRLGGTGIGHAIGAHPQDLRSAPARHTVSGTFENRVLYLNGIERLVEVR